MKRILIIGLVLLFSMSFISCSQTNVTCLDDQELSSGICVDTEEDEKPIVNTENLFYINTGNIEGWDIFTNFRDEPTVSIENGVFTFNQVFIDGTYDSSTTWARKISYELEDIQGELNYSLQFKVNGTAGETFSIFIQLGASSNPIEVDYTLDGSDQQFIVDIYHPLTVSGNGLFKIGFGTFSNGSSMIISDITITKTDLEEPDLNVLFVGNSHTYYNDMPDMVEAMGLVMGYNINVVDLTMGGYTLENFLDPESAVYQTLLNYLDTVSWDYVVIQGHSLLPAFYKQDFINTVGKMNKLITESGSEMILYQTWSYRDGSEILDSIGLEYAEMHNLLKNAYQEAADFYSAQLAPVGNVFYNLTIDETGIDVLNADDYHPSLLGSYTAALTFYTMLFGEGYDNTYLPEGVSSSEASTIRTYVYAVLREE